ncbi:MAG: hypothetical protein ACREKS_05430 [Candidatus Rokuibacteriota bacterium]
MRLVAALLVLLLAVIPALELACDGSAGAGHDYCHLHASAALPVQSLGPPVVPLLGLGLVLQHASHLPVAIHSIFVPPRLR